MQLRFRPAPKYRPQPDTALLTRIKGDLWFDAGTFAITRMEYELLADAGSSVDKPSRGSRFTIVLADLADKHYLPASATVRHILPKGGAETSTLEFAKYQRFATDSSVQFLERDK